MTLFDDHLPPPADLHCHLAEAGGYGQVPADALILAVTNDPAAWRRLGRRPQLDRVTWAVGLHPRVLRRDDTRVADLLAAIPSARAIGEIGLDYSSGATADGATQRNALDTILSDPETQRRLVTIHSVAAAEDVVVALGEHHVPGAVLHWFLGTPPYLERAIDLDAYFSVNSAMLSSTRGRTAVAAMPPNRVLVETDAPFAKKGKTPLAPGDVAHAEATLARMWYVEPSEVRHRLWDNLQALERRLHVRVFAESVARSEDHPGGYGRS